MKHASSACIFSQVYSTDKVGIKMHVLSCVSSQLLVSAFDCSPYTSTENFKIFPTLVYIVSQYTYLARCSSNVVARVLVISNKRVVLAVHLL